MKIKRNIKDKYATQMLPNNEKVLKRRKINIINGKK